eukprot:CFRG3599T1
MSASERPLVVDVGASLDLLEKLKDEGVLYSVPLLASLTLTASARGRSERQHYRALVLYADTLFQLEEFKRAEEHYRLATNILESYTLSKKVGTLQQGSGGLFYQRKRTYNSDGRHGERAVSDADSEDMEECNGAIDDSSSNSVYNNGRKERRYSRLLSAADLLYRMHECAVKRKDWQSAYDSLQQIPTENRTVKILTALGTTAVCMGRRAEARRYLRSALQHQPLLLDVALQLANLNESRADVLDLMEGQHPIQPYIQKSRNLKDTRKCQSRTGSEMNRSMSPISAPDPREWLNTPPSHSIETEQNTHTNKQLHSKHIVNLGKLTADSNTNALIQTQTCTGQTRTVRDCGDGCGYHISWVVDAARALLFVQNDENKRAREGLDRLTKNFPENVSLLCMKGEQSWQAGNFGDACKAYNQVRSLDSNCLDGMDLYAHALTHNSRGDEVISLAYELLTVTRYRPEPWLAMAHGSHHTSDKNAAMIFARKARDLAPYFPRSRLFYGRMLIDVKQLKDGLLELQAAYEQSRTYACCHALVMVFAQLQNYKSAKNYVGNLIAVMPWSSRAIALKGIAEGQMFAKCGGNIGLASKYFNKALQMNPNCKDALQALVQAAVEQRDWEKSIIILKQLLPLRNNDSTHTQLGDILTVNKQFKDALWHYQAALSLNPRFSRALAGVRMVQALLYGNDESIADGNEEDIHPESELDVDHSILRTDISDANYGRGNYDTDNSGSNDEPIVEDDMSDMEVF